MLGVAQQQRFQGEISCQVNNIRHQLSSIPTNVRLNGYSVATYPIHTSHNTIAHHPLLSVSSQPTYQHASIRCYTAPPRPYQYHQATTLRPHHRAPYTASYQSSWRVTLCCPLDGIGERIARNDA